MDRAAGIIPARLNSKGIHRKPLATLAGRPLISWTIEAALQSTVLSAIYVSTDSEEIASLSENLGAKVIPRPDDLASDATPASAVIRHAMESCPPHKTFAYLQPTSPLRTAMDIDKCLEKLSESDATAIASVSPLTFPAEWIVTITDGERIRRPLGREIPRRRQDTHMYYLLNGAIFAADWEALAGHGDIYRLDLIGYVMPLERGIDIDTPEDLQRAEMLLSLTDENAHASNFQTTSLSQTSRVKRRKPK